MDKTIFMCTCKKQCPCSGEIHTRGFRGDKSVTFSQVVQKRNKRSCLRERYSRCGEM